MARLTLSSTFRLTAPMAWFVNETMLGEARLVATKAGPPVVYMYVDPFMASKTIGALILGFIRRGEATAGDIFVLTPSLKNSKPVKLLENFLVTQDPLVPCYVPMSEDQEISKDAAANKVKRGPYLLWEGPPFVAGLCLRQRSARMRRPIRCRRGPSARVRLQLYVHCLLP